MADEKTSKSVAGKAGRVLNDPASTADERSVAASALSQAGDVDAKSEPGAVATGSTTNAGEGARDPNEEVESGPPKKLVRFRANEKSPVIDIQAGEYRRTFRAEDQPFEVESDEELQMLRRTGHFVEDKEAERAAEAATDDGRATDKD